MQSLLERRLGNDRDFQDVKACRKKAYKAGILSVFIGGGVTYGILKLTKTFESQPRYIPLTCLGVGVVCGYIKSILVIQKYRSKQKELVQEQDSIPPTAKESPTQKVVSSSQSKYGDDNFFMDEKGSK